MPYSIGAGIGVAATAVLNHNLGVIPNATVDAQGLLAGGGVAAIGAISALTTTQMTLTFVNLTPAPVSSTALVYIW